MILFKPNKIIISILELMIIKSKLAKTLFNIAKITTLS